MARGANGWRIAAKPTALRHARACPGHPRLHSLTAAKTWMAGSSPAMTMSELLSAALIRRNLDQAAVRIPAIDRPQRAAGALFGDRAFLDCDAVGFEMRDHLVRGACGQKAQIVTACGLVVGGEPLDLVGAARPHVDLLIAEHQRGSRCLARTGIEYADLHAEDGAIPFGGARHVGDVDHEMVEGVHLDGHDLSFRRGRKRLCRTGRVWVCLLQ